MPAQAPLYDLMLLLSIEAPEEQRAKILADVEREITSGGGSIESNADWGRRALSYQISHQPEAEYHLLQFSSPPGIIEPLSHDLGIMDGVLRHRIIKVIPGTPPPPSSPPPVIAAPQVAPQVAAPVAAAVAAPADEPRDERDEAEQ